MLSHGIFTQVLSLIYTGVVQCLSCMMYDAGFTFLIRKGEICFDLNLTDFAFSARFKEGFNLQLGCQLILLGSLVLLTTASLRRSFRLRKDRPSSPGEPHTPDANHTDFLIYEEVMQYVSRSGQRPRLVVLIGRFCLLKDSV